MKTRHAQHISRREMLRQISLATGAAAALPLIGLAGMSQAMAAEEPAKASQSAVQYQDHPKGTSACANCANFIPGPGSDEPGSCTVVAGEISPKGWCLAYAGNG
ncbi:iron oxidase [Allopusillimonas soli]|uniref:High-potential iron-sulfur protein n=1 Tax=Allopusillimonas soli TaxID=659016 RepID=A0A853FBT2_9BURK|nr:high-potential iron-sulfur protein [Allopusillimonas soli]NYT37407.1 high-potential iron-sulfur protein [Allopusillimonas soli]TEA74611.1 iron oxidase [Allopusillimonas soli]